jgi:hypothetical protein
MNHPRPLLPYLVIPALPLLVPLIAMRFTEEVRWSAFDFVAAYILLAGAGFAYRLATSRTASTAYRAAAALAVLGCLALIWVNLAVGFIGDENNPANLLYLGVPAIGVIGAIAANFSARGMARTLYVMAAWQFLVPGVAWVLWPARFDANAPAIILLNAVWVALFAVAGRLFQRSAPPPA